MPRGGGETYRQGGERAVACLQEALTDVAPGGALVAVTHGGTARGALCLLLDLDPSQWWRLAALGNTSWSVLVEHARRLAARAARGQPWRAGRAGVVGPPSSPDAEPVRY